MEWPTTGILWLLLVVAIAAKSVAAISSEDDSSSNAKKIFQDTDPSSREEIKMRLGLLVDLMDGDSNGMVTLTELKDWIAQASRRYIENDVARLWKRLNPENNGNITWNVYQSTIYGYDLAGYRSLINRDRRRWKVADRDRDDSLSHEEFSEFLHSNNHTIMRDVVLKEMFDDLDLDHDGKISLAEYLLDMYQPDSTDEETPEWVGEERDVFGKFLDLDGDGFLSEAETRQWIAPHGPGQTDSQALRLFMEADADKDEQLTKAEILDKYNTFLSSPATEYGGSLMRHDEL
ncbi:calumenin-like [Drosophila pseudoobscura]|uniref:Reticulocalbin-3 n=1 Tax=Drosophila pseudoobscura pseudoobscura TaxID=46245 RepID=A0A6I8V0K1_DROPS|nr:calumenin [Drosophila pseudoobscura]